MILTGDSLKKLRTLPSESVQMCVTSPPYWGLRDYGTAKWKGGESACNHAVDSQSAAMKQKRSTLGPKHDGLTADNAYFKGVGELYRDVCGKCGAIRMDDQLGLEATPELYVAHLVAVFREVRRVLKNDGVLWLNLGDSYATGGGKVGDCPGGGKQGERWAGARGANPTNSKRGVNMGPISQPNRMPLPGLKPKDLIGIPWRVAFALQADGWYLRSDIIWHKPNPMPESVTDRPTKSHEYLFLLSKNAKYFYDAGAVAEPLAQCNAQRTTKTYNTAERYGANNGGNSGLDKLAASIRDGTHTTRNRRTVWSINTKPFKGAHFATFPTALIEPCILAGSRPSDVVLDPFAGAFTTPLVAQLHGRDFIAIELNPAYVKLGKARIAAASPAALKRHAAA